MSHRAPQDDHWRGLRLAVHARRTRVIVAVIGLLISVGMPTLVWGTSGFTVDGQPAGPALDDPAGLGITGALPGDPLPDSPLSGDGVPGTGVPGEGVPGDFGDAGPPGIPTPSNLPDGPLGIPGAMLDAYQFAESTLVATQPGCHLSWSLLAGIGRIESGHARGGRVDAAGNTLGPILGPALDGSPGVAAIADTDRGVLDQDTVWDHAVGPMQFIPTSWRSYGVDGNGDGAASPHNIYDSTIAAASYLCAGNGDLSDPAQLQAAIFRYNHSATYVTIVLQWAQAYLSGVVSTSSAPGPVPPGTNGNGGLPMVVDSARQAAALLAAVAPHAPPVTPPPVTSTPPAPATTTPPRETDSIPTPTTPPPTTTPSPTETDSSPTPTPPPGTDSSPTPTPPPGTDSSPTPTPPPATPTPAPATPTTTPPPTNSSPPPPPPPTTTTTPVEPTSSPPPPPPLAAL